MQKTMKSAKSIKRVQVLKKTKMLILTTKKNVEVAVAATMAMAKTPIVKYTQRIKAK